MAYGYGAAPIVHRTQKARGIKALADRFSNVPKHEIFPIEYFVGNAPYSPESQIDQDKLTSLVNKFVRPCPITPRHGFVDSRPITSIEEAEKIVRETMAAESKAELVAMPFIKADYSAIWTKGALVIGTSNDGATSGRSSYTIPVIGDPVDEKNAWELAMQIATITESPYLELLWEKKYISSSNPFSISLVQLRNGPEIPQTTDYIPTEYTVKNVILAEGELLDWESKIKTVPQGTVIYHPNGSLASHYAVHAVLNGIPVLISREPKVGEVLRPTVNESKPDINKIRAGFYYGATVKDFETKPAGIIMVAALHNSTSWLGKRDELLGFGMGIAYRLTVLAVLGEMRHHFSRKRKPARNKVYKKCWNKVLTNGIRTRYVKALTSFKNDEWPSQFGGMKWYNFGSFAANLYNALIDRDVTASVEQFNKLINAVHNGGWGFNKFLSESVMNDCAANPCPTTLKIAPFLYECIKSVEVEPVDFFKGKQHFYAEPLDEVAAKASISREMKGEDNETNELYRDSKKLKNEICEECGQKEEDCCGSEECCHTPENLAAYKARKEEKKSKINKLVAPIGNLFNPSYGFVTYGEACLYNDKLDIVSSYHQISSGTYKLFVNYQQEVTSPNTMAYILTAEQAKKIFKAFEIGEKINSKYFGYPNYYKLIPSDILEYRFRIHNQGGSPIIDLNKSEIKFYD